VEKTPPISSIGVVDWATVKGTYEGPHLSTKKEGKKNLGKWKKVRAGGHKTPSERKGEHGRPCPGGSGKCEGDGKKKRQQIEDPERRHGSAFSWAALVGIHWGKGLPSCDGGGLEERDHAVPPRELPNSEWPNTRPCLGELRLSKTRGRTKALPEVWKQKTGGLLTIVPWEGRAATIMDALPYQRRTPWGSCEPHGSTGMRLAVLMGGRIKEAGKTAARGRRLNLPARTNRVEDDVAYCQQDRLANARPVAGMGGNCGGSDYVKRSSVPMTALPWGKGESNR